MAHEIPVNEEERKSFNLDPNTSVGYNFLTKEYYVKNLETKTTLNTPIETKQILDVTSPFNTVSEADIEMLSQLLEPLTSISYAWEDTGKYIKAIYFNDYKDYAIVYNEPYLFIKGSVEMWDMSSSLSKDAIRDFFWSYYTFNLGLDVEVATMDAIIDYYDKIQSPYVYNNILPREDKEDTLMYSNMFTMNNADKSSRGEYTGTKNPDNIYSMDVYDVVKTGQVTENITYPIYSMQVTGNRILLDEVMTSGQLVIGGTFEIHGTPNDKGYTAALIDTQTLLSGKTVTRIITNEYFDEDFTANMYDFAYIKLPATTTRNENSITVKTTPMVKRGDILQLRGTSNVNNLVVNRVEGSKIMLNATPAVGVHTEAGNKLYASSYRILKMGYDDRVEVLGAMGVNKIAETVVTLSGWVYATTFKIGQQVYVNYGHNVVKGPYTINSIAPTVMSGTTMSGGTITLSGSPGDYTSTVGIEPVAVEIRNSTQIEEDSITIELPINLNEDEIIEVKNTDGWNGNYTVEYTEAVGNNTKIWIKRDDYFEGFDKWYKDAEQTKKGVVQLRQYSDRILLDMTYSKRADKMPTGKFMLDNDQQFTNYLISYHIVPPSSTNYADLGQPVTLKYFLGEYLTVPVMDCVGLYSEVFTEEDQ